jgi:quercetin dioxygenase-like cupin family protein
MRSRRVAASLALAGLAALVVSACGGDDAPAEETVSASAEAAPGEAAAVLLDAQSLTALDQPVAYPQKGQAQISSEMEVLEPGQESGWRKYRVPAYVHVLEGTLSVEYDAGVVKEFPAGTAFLQAKGVWHNVSNKGDVRAQFLTVMMGAKGIAGVAER